MRVTSHDVMQEKLFLLHVCSRQWDKRFVLRTHSLNFSWWLYVVKSSGAISLPVRYGHSCVGSCQSSAHPLIVDMRIHIYSTEYELHFSTVIYLRRYCDLCFLLLLPPLHDSDCLKHKEYYFEGINQLTPNDHFSGRTAPLTSRCCIFYLFNKHTYWIF